MILLKFINKNLTESLWNKNEALAEKLMHMQFKLVQEAFELLHEKGLEDEFYYWYEDNFAADFRRFADKIEELSAKRKMQTLSE